EGRIESVSVSDPKRARIVLLPTKLRDSTNNVPQRVRLTVIGEKAVNAVSPGASVSALAMLRPPPEPVEPGGYDFARWAYFGGIGGIGFTYGAPKLLSAPLKPSWEQELETKIENLRVAMTARVQAIVPGDEGAIAAALITGERAAIDDDDNNAFRNS